MLLKTTDADTGQFTYYSVNLVPDRREFQLTMWITFAILLTLCLAVYLYFQHRYRYWKNRNIPFVVPKLVVGNIVEIFMGKYSPAKYVAHLCDERDGPYVGFFILHKPYLAIKDPSIIKKILVRDFQKFPDKIFINDKSIDPTFSNSLLSLGNTQWRAVRSRLSCIFSPSKIKAMQFYTEKCAKSLRLYIDGQLNERVNLKDLTTRFSTEVVFSCVFGVNSNCFKEKQSICNYYAHKIFPKAFVGVFKGFSYIFLPQLVKIFKYQFFDPTACDFFQNIFSDTIKHRETSGVRRNDLVDILIDIKNQNGSFDNNALLAQAIAFLGVGHETISAIISLTIYELCINQDIQNRLREEIESVVGEDDVTSIDHLKFLNMVVCESLRKYPVIPFIQRKCVEEYFIPETGAVLERGTSIIIPIHWLHFNPAFFDDPHKYNPDRFNEDTSIPIDPFVYLPFSTGPRACLGRRFALMSIKVCLIYLIRSFKIEKDIATKDQLNFGAAHALNPKDGIPVRFQRIQESYARSLQKQ